MPVRLNRRQASSPPLTHTGTLPHLAHRQHLPGAWCPGAGDSLQDHCEPLLGTPAPTLPSLWYRRPFFLDGMKASDKDILTKEAKTPKPTAVNKKSNASEVKRGEERFSSSRSWPPCFGECAYYTGETNTSKAWTEKKNHGLNTDFLVLQNPLLMRRPLISTRTKTTTAKLEKRVCSMFKISRYLK